MNRLSTSVLITYLLGQSSKYSPHWLSNCVTIFRIGMFPEIMNVPFQVPLDVPLSDLFLSNSLLFPLQFSEELQTSGQIFTKPPRIRIMVQSVWDQYGKIGFPTELKCGTTNCANCDLDLSSNVTQLKRPTLICCGKPQNSWVPSV